MAGLERFKPERASQAIPTQIAYPEGYGGQTSFKPERASQAIPTVVLLV